MFDKILVANRGEIALRVVRTCRELGIRTVVVHSSDDRESAAVTAADEAIHIGPAAARRSYLNMAAVLEAGVRAGADAVHPGYGFLSEDPDFAEAAEEAGMTFIGPPPGVLERLGRKSEARSLMADAGLPVLPGGIGSQDTLEAARRAAADAGFPLIVKAVAGGGGRGTRVVHHPGDLAAAYAATRRDARALFGDDRVYVERYVTGARHVEVQVLCDRYRNALHLGERDCSVQRRNQKLIEETPAPRLPGELLDAMRGSAVRGALAADYVGAGTFEFLVDRHGEFHFMEVNSRLQVEHPVTEMATGLDLVREQIRIAAGEPLGLRQQDVRPRGVAIECRINAEDPERDFAPSPGLLTEFRPPGGPFVRVDTHATAGMGISPAYDSLVAKVIVWAPDRSGAIARMRRALAELRVGGPSIRTTSDFLVRVLEHPSFVAAEHDTSIVAEMRRAGS
ncbi:acetyl-CoA carboxylase biotin carboxylase subunit [Actinomadura harenae]|uniref:biotin carboxylase n=1 Tax=Actinomadura harenae TaxID=2483351 RepID=A0A3M2M0R0_9ACTN|nr:biotin carboxylase N-terminal domain-containing protein [Actinomadura harenae]RMI43167.1 ATP-grasp domain-containing protein [Actinomadura harenae]